jgi:streptogramin lyase
VLTNHPDNNPEGSGPWQVTTGSDGALWFTGIVSDVIGTMTTSGATNSFGYPLPNGLTIVGPTGITSGPDGQLWFTNAGGNSIGSITTAGVISNYTDPTIAEPLDIAAGSDGALWFTNYGNNSIGRITTAGVVSNYTGPSISEPDGITAGPDGAMWFTNLGNNSIGRITTAGVVTNYHKASVSTPLNIAAGPDGALWFTNSGNNSIGRITTKGVITKYTDPTIVDPDGITAGPDGAMWFTNYGDDTATPPNPGSIGRISTGASGVPRTISSPVTANATVKTPFSFTVTTTGSPTPKIVEKGKLPKHVKFVNNGDGTATLSGRPTTSGVDSFSIDAIYGTKTFTQVVDQSFTLTVSPASSDGRAHRSSRSP